MKFPRFPDFALHWWWTERQRLFDWLTKCLSPTVLLYSCSLEGLLQFAIYGVLHFPNLAPLINLKCSIAPPVSVHRPRSFNNLVSLYLDASSQSNILIYLGCTVLIKPPTPQNTIPIFLTYGNSQEDLTSFTHLLSTTQTHDAYFSATTKCLLPMCRKLLPYI